MKMSCTVTTRFSAAKRLLHWQGKCHQLHGYQHRVEASFAVVQAGDSECEEVAKSNQQSLVADFYVLKEKLNQWLEANWDHTVILHQDDAALAAAIETTTGQKIFRLPQDPTAEAMAQHLKHVCDGFLPGVRCTSLRLYDDETAWVEVR